jgi:hypothetical protein
MQAGMITMQDRESSVFTGSVLGYLGISILSILITLLTFGIGLPWAICIEQKWVIEHTEIDGKNLGFFAPCGYVSPQYYDNKGAGFLKSFTAGFLTTCGLTAVGSPCVDDGEELPICPRCGIATGWVRF